MEAKNEETTHRLIDTGWRVRELPRESASPTTVLNWLPAQVPGNIHLDLARAGVIPNPFYRMYERDVAWVDECDWQYETSFTLSDPLPAHAYLRFDGLDTIAEIALNGEALGTTENMFIPHEFLVDGKLQAGENTLQVSFRSALRIGRERQKAWNDAGNDTTETHWNNWGPRSFVRKAQYMYGWDWGPELVSCGIWRPVELISVPVARILDWKYDVEFAGDKAVVSVEADVERAPNALDTPLAFRAALPFVSNNGDRFTEGLPGPVAVDVPGGAKQAKVRAKITIDNPRLWRPRGMEKPGKAVESALYGAELALLAGEKTVAARKVKIGLRTIELVRENDPDGKGQGFKFRVNGRDVFAKGANWIPADSFPARLRDEAYPEPNGDRYIDPQGNPYTGMFRYETEHLQRIESLVRTAADAGYNMLRVWGGGLYESEHFYDLCDEVGMMVWQDFPYACAYYPDTGVYAEEAGREARAAVRRIRNHASLAIWCGNNENLTMFQGNWSGNRPARYLGEHIYNEVLPGVLRQEDSKTAYIPSSPQGGEDANSPDYGDRHNWDVWHGVGDWVHYAKDRSRFCSEFGFASSCGMATWDSCLAPADKWPQSPAVQWHDKTRKGYETYFGLFTLHHVVPQTLEDLVYYTQINQAEALKYGIQHYRRNKGRCWGTLFWQINDCWPVQSWATIDYLGVPKAAHYASRRFYAPVMLTLFKAEDKNIAQVHLVSDLSVPIDGAVTATIETFDGAVLAREEFSGSVETNGVGLIGEMNLSAASGRERECYVYAVFLPRAGAQEPGHEAFLFLAEPKEMRLTNPGVSFALREEADRCVITLQSLRFAPYVWLDVEQSDYADIIQMSDNFFHLRAGETKEVWLSRRKGVRLADVLGRIKVRTL